MSTVGYHIDEVMELLKHTYSFRDVTKQDVKDILGMLAGDYEHRREIPVRPRLLYDRIHEQVSGDNYSRMLAVAAGGTIPDKGLFALKNAEGVHIGELDEEFVFEVRVGEKIILGSFAWRISQIKNDMVIVEPASIDGARLPFWKGEIKGRSFSTSLEFGKMFSKFALGIEENTIIDDLKAMGLNESATQSAADFLRRQIVATGVLPNDKTIIVEHFTDHTGCHQIMVHAMFGRQINTPLALLMRHVAEKAVLVNIGCVDEEDGFLLYPYGEEILPEGLIFAIPPKGARKTLEAMLPVTPVFNMTFRYNAGRSLMMGMKSQGRQPLWLQRLKSTELLDSLRIDGKFTDANHPLIRETKRECLEELWDIDGVLRILGDIHSGEITVREVHTELPSPMALPLQWAVEAAEIYSYFPTTDGVRQAVTAELKMAEMMKPAPEELEKQKTRSKYPENAEQLHTLLMIEGDLLAEELRDICRRENTLWINELAEKGLATYIEPGLWIAAEQLPEYTEALGEGGSASTDGALRECLAFSLNGSDNCNEVNENARKSALQNIIQRMIYYRGAMSDEQISERYFLPLELINDTLNALINADKVIFDEGTRTNPYRLFYHSKRYSRAQKATIFGLRAQAVTRPAEVYAAIIAARLAKNASPEEQLELTIRQYAGVAFPAAWWETVILPRRVKGYRENMLDRLLAGGEYFWRFEENGSLCFERYNDIDWEEGLHDSNLLSLSTENLESGFTPDEALIYQELKKRGASFLQAFNNLTLYGSAQEGLLALAEKGLVCSDSFLPVRQWLNRDKIKKASPRARVKTRVMALSTGRWDIVRPLKSKKLEDWLIKLFDRNIILCRETYSRLSGEDNGWGQALSVLRIWEYIGKVRRGYFISGMSGAQFIRAEEYDGIMAALAQTEASFGRKNVEKMPFFQDIIDNERIVWLNAVDPGQVWGKALAGKNFMNVPGTLVALYNGVPQVVLERQGKVLRVLGGLEGKEELGVGDNELTENNNRTLLTQIMAEFILLMKQKKVFPDKKRITIKEYPPEMVPILKEVGFYKEMMDYVWYEY